MNRMKTVLGVSIAALIAFGGVLSVADVGQAVERDRKGDREWSDEGDWKGEWKRDRDDDDDRDDDWRGRRGDGRGYWGGYGRATGVGTDRPYGYYRRPGYYGGGCGWLYRNAYTAGHCYNRDEIRELQRRWPETNWPRSMRCFPYR